MSRFSMGEQARSCCILFFVFGTMCGQGLVGERIGAFDEPVASAFLCGQSAFLDDGKDALTCDPALAVNILDERRGFRDGQVIVKGLRRGIFGRRGLAGFGLWHTDRLSCVCVDSSHSAKYCQRATCSALKPKDFQRAMTLVGFVLTVYSKVLVSCLN